MMTCISKGTRRGGGFSLVELIAVVGIIVILAGLLFPAVASLLKKAELARAQNEVDMVANSIRQYFVETGQLPLDNTGNCARTHNWVNTYNNSIHSTNRIATIDSTTRATLANLAAKLTIPAQNPARRVFLEMETDSNGLLVDPWGNPFGIRLDCAQSTLGGNLVIVVSAGPDGYFQTSEYVGGLLDPSYFGSDDDISSRR